MNRWARSVDPYRTRMPRPQPVPRLGRDLAEGPVHVLAVVDRYPPLVNAGAEWMLHGLLRDSAARGHRVTVATPCCAEPYDLDGVQVHPYPAGLSVAHDAELVVGHLAFTAEAVGHAQERGLPLVYLLHNDNQARWWGIDKDRASALIWNSEWIGRKMRSERDLLGIPATVIRPPLTRQPRPASSDREFVTLVNPIEAKGSGIFYDLAARRRDLRFLAVEGAYGSQVRPGTKDGNVEWQPQTGDMAADVWPRTRVLLVPSSYESWGLAAVEALACGIPVIAAPTPGLRESLGDAATFVPHDDPAGWARALAALDDPGMYDAAAGAALIRSGQLAAQQALDLDRFDIVVRLAAGARRVRSGVMTTTRYDPYAHRATTAPTIAQDAPDGNPGADPPQDDPAAPAAVQPPFVVPQRAADIVVALRQTTDPEQAKARAQAVAAVEDARPEGRRRSVDRALAEILG